LERVRRDCGLLFEPDGDFAKCGEYLYVSWGEDFVLIPENKFKFLFMYIRNIC
jgi:hypothetical protein